MTAETITRLLRRTLAAYPQHTGKLSAGQIKDMQEVWLDMLDDIPDDMLIAAVRNHIDRSEWLPSIAEIRKSAVSLMREASPASQAAIDAWGEVKMAFRRVEPTDKPHFANPITARVVQRMGWFALSTSDSPEAVDRAQFERYYNAEMARVEQQAVQSPAVAAFIASMNADTFIEAPQERVASLTAQVAARLTSPERDMAVPRESLGY